MPTYVYFFLALAALIIGYFTYGVLVEKLFGVKEDRPTPVCKYEDSVDYVKLTPKKIFLIQLLNIAGLGPIFGPILGALYGPSALLWVVFGCIFVGAVHDFCTGMMSVRYDGKSIPDVVGYNLGNGIKAVMQVFTVIMLILVGVVFVAGPAGLLAKITGLNLMFWVVAVFVYYILATLLPIDKIIGRFYPFFGIFLAFMAVGLIVGLFCSDYTVLNESFLRPAVHPEGLPIWPMVFITIACGAVSGFHATQSTMMSRCITSERYGRRIFYGAMIAEGVIALIWVTLGMSVYPTPEALSEVMGPSGNAALVVEDVSFKLLGSVGGAMAVLGVIVLPITSGDTAFRSARLIMADAFNFSQKKIMPRLILALPIFAVAIALNCVDFSVLWRYFGWGNQTLAAIVLWASAVYMLKREKFHWIASLPAMFMTAVSVAYICMEPKLGFNLGAEAANVIAVVFSAACMFLMLMFGKKKALPDFD
ncbi:MAG: carbon starvation protein A [Alphaproteobacteria bacterium]|nr:carbon starvation protein A [Alphaproteobacteria bacterium]